MGTVKDFAAGRARRDNRLKRELVDALKLLGGSAHLNQIVAQVIVRRAKVGEACPPEFAAAMLNCLCVYEGLSANDAATRGRAFYRAFGPQSARWYLAPAATAATPAANASEALKT